MTPMPPSLELTGAIPKQLHALLAGMRERHEVTVITVAGPDPGELAAADRLREDGVDAHVVRRLAGGPLGSWRRRSRIVWGWTALRLPWRPLWCYAADAQGLIDRLTAGDAFDLVAVEDNAMAVYRYPAGLPSVLTEHEVRRPRRARWPRPGSPGWPSRILAEIDWGRWRRYQARAWARFDLVQTFTARDAASVVEMVPALQGRTRVIPFGIDVPPACNPGLQEPGSLLFAGSMTHYPNVDAALWLARDVLPKIRSRNPGARLVIAGPHPPPEVQALAGEYVEVTGWVPELRPVMERAEVVLAPVRTGGGMRMKVLEAMALGKAVVTTPRGAEGLQVGDHLPPLRVADDPQAIAEATLALLEDRETRESMARAARAFVEEHHGSRAYATRLEAIYREAAG